MSTRSADGGAIGSIVLWIGVHLADINTVVQIIAGLVAIGAGLTAMWFHIKKGRALNK